MGVIPLWLGILRLRLSRWQGDSRVGGRWAWFGCGADYCLGMIPAVAGWVSDWLHQDQPAGMSPGWPGMAAVVGVFRAFGLFPVVRVLGPASWAAGFGVRVAGAVNPAWAGMFDGSFHSGRFAGWIPAWSGGVDVPRIIAFNGGITPSRGIVSPVIECALAMIG